MISKDTRFVIVVFLVGSIVGYFFGVQDGREQHVTEQTIDQRLGDLGRLELKVEHIPDEDRRKWVAVISTDTWTRVGLGKTYTEAMEDALDVPAMKKGP